MSTPKLRYLRASQQYVLKEGSFDVNASIGSSKVSMENVRLVYACTIESDPLELVTQGGVLKAKVPTIGIELGVELSNINAQTRLDLASVAAAHSLQRLQASYTATVMGANQAALTKYVADKGALSLENFAKLLGAVKQLLLDLGAANEPTPSLPTRAMFHQPSTTSTLRDAQLIALAVSCVKGDKSLSEALAIAADRGFKDDASARAVRSTYTSFQLLGDNEKPDAPQELAAAKWLFANG